MARPAPASTSLRMSSLPAQQPQLGPFENQQDRPEHHGERTRHSKRLRSKSRPINVEDHHIRRMERQWGGTALREHKHEREHLSSGSVTRQKRRQALPPSTRAASKYA